MRCQQNNDKAPKDCMSRALQTGPQRKQLAQCTFSQKTSDIAWLFSQDEPDPKVEVFE
jgi:hypothetical protein